MVTLTILIAIFCFRIICIKNCIICLSCLSVVNVNVYFTYNYYYNDLLPQIVKFVTVGFFTIKNNR